MKRAALGAAVFFGGVLGAPRLSAGEVTVAWDPNTEPDLAGYRIHYGTASRSYTQIIDVGNATTYTITGLAEGTTYFSAVTAYNQSDLESGYSNEISFAVAAVAPLPETSEPDSDRDGLPDRFEAFYGNGEDLHPLSDHDGDGLTALAEYAHGQDPNAPLVGPIVEPDIIFVNGHHYLCIRFLVNPFALEFVDIEVERRYDLDDPYGWAPGETVLMWALPSVTHPGLLEFTERSPTPVGTHRMEFLRVRHRSRFGPVEDDDSEPQPGKELDLPTGHGGHAVRSPKSR